MNNQVSVRYVLHADNDSVTTVGYASVAAAQEDLERCGFEQDDYFTGNNGTVLVYIGETEGAFLDTCDGELPEELVDENRERQADIDACDAGV